MEAITYTTARQKLAETMDKVIDSHSAVIITRQKAGAVVMMSLEDFNSIEETLYLLGNPANAKRLRKAVADVDAGQVTEITMDDLDQI
ncbi:type II toxin-antitoxin system prevent-host-death family antitoxin [Desulfosarcina sp. OttesenSCG-928-A07]|nr:type II toxin-antitoxin system prevent-host-death family antitoxin [Desulfosarcina sp. OttesenSCG-928-A07]